MKKKIIATAAALMMMAAPAMAQVFIMDDDEYNGNRSSTDNPSAMVPQQDVNWDQYVPVGSGALLLAGLAGAYLVGKRRKEE